MKKLISILTLAAIVCGLSACGSKEEAIIQSTETTRAFTTPIETIPDLFDEPFDEPITDAPTQEPRLSDNCDKIMYTVKDGADYFELVVDEDINYPKNIYRFGVIKNNQWLVEMSTESPFLNDDNTWKSLEDFGADPLEYIHFEYLGEGCFLYYADFVSINMNNSGIFYNPSTNLSLPVWNMYFYNDSYEYVVNNGQAIVATEPLVDSSKFFEWALLNTNNGTLTTINGYFNNNNWSVSKLQGISEDLFMAIINKSSREYIVGFFNFNGELIIDLTDYGYIDEESDYRFINGKCSFITRNDSGVEFRITIDKTGQILSSEQV